ncbi:hypothetical protein P280DRAFT_505876 [Massarina eburnea CBS 473.64]|uniref:Integral membrane protein-like protein n=1 Tax=Massarina eburnea CBS 473.64 TaxID=1395130 RepID=A0A6A6S5B4_9PLEO|nr:hypothetical protein P280DRAFT_505876 [Massarina eburnea CBS 473.64]
MPPYGLPSYGLSTPQSFLQRNFSYFNEKIDIEPDMDARHSIEKALPKPPITPKTVMKKFRFSAVLVFAAGVVVLVLGLLVILAGKNVGQLEGEFSLKLNTSRVGEDTIRVERASATTTATPTATTTKAKDQLDPLGIFATSSPLSPQNPSNPLNGAMNNLTDNINDGLGDAFNTVIEGLVDQTGIKDFYYLYLNHVCEGSTTNGTSANADGVEVSKCQSWHNASESLKGTLSTIKSSVTIGNTKISVPLLASLASGESKIFSTLTALRQAILAFLIITIISSALLALISLPSIFFPESRLLIFTNLFLSGLASLFSLLAAILLTILVIVIPWAVGNLTESFGVVIEEGGYVLIFLWVVWVLSAFMLAFWGSVWFVEVRRYALVTEALAVCFFYCFPRSFACH